MSPDPATPNLAGHHILLCCDCEGTRRQLTDLWQAIDRAGVAANFFFVGETALQFPALVRAIAERHQAESHTLRHQRLRGMSLKRQRFAIAEGRHVVEDTIGRPTRGFRAPCHAIDANTARVLVEEDFTFDASGLYYRWVDFGPVVELRPTWFREWMPLYARLGLSPATTYGLFRWLVRHNRLCVLPAHPHYAALDEELLCAFEGFLRWAKAGGATFWPIDKWLAAEHGVAPPEWVSPLGPPLARRQRP